MKEKFSESKTDIERLNTTDEQKDSNMRTTAAGSYPKTPNRPRPARLRQAIARRDRGDITAEELARVEDEVTIEVVAEQAEAGLDLVTDGQIRWDDDQTYIAQRLHGFEITGLIRYFDTNTYYRQPNVTAPVRWQQPILVRDYEFAAGHSTKPVKALITGPYTLAALSNDSHYGDRSQLVLVLAEALRQEAKALAAAGASVIQVNEPAILRHKEDGPLLQEAITIMLDGIDAETALYTWFGDADGILPLLMDIPVDVIGLDFISGPGNWEALKRVSFSKVLGFGIIDARNTRMEPVEEIAEQIQRVSEFVPAERLYVNPSCGLEYLPREVAFEKLKRLVEGVRRAGAVAV